MRVFLATVALAASLLADMNTFAQRSAPAGGWMCPCGPGRQIPLGGYASCNEACGGGAPRETGAVDEERRRREREAAVESQRREEEAREAEWRRRIEQQQREDSARQDQFIRDRDAAGATLRGSGNQTPFFGGQLRGSTGDADMRVTTSNPSAAAVASAWKQLHCAASLSGAAAAALNLRGGRTPDYREAKYLAGEAISAATGNRPGVECPNVTADIPAAYGAGNQYQQRNERYVSLLRRWQQAIDTLVQVRSERLKLAQRLIAAKEAIAATRPKPDPTLSRDIERLQSEKDRLVALLPQETRPAANPAAPSPGLIEPPKPETRSAMAEALAAQREAQRQYEALGKNESDLVRELERVAAVSTRLSGGDSEAVGMLDQFR